MLRSSSSARSGRFTRRAMVRLALALPWVALAAGCGQKGPLYYPPEPAGKKKKDKTNAAPGA